MKIKEISQNLVLDTLIRRYGLEYGLKEDLQIETMIALNCKEKYEELKKIYNNKYCIKYQVTTEEDETMSLGEFNLIHDIECIETELINSLNGRKYPSISRGEYICK